MGLLIMPSLSHCTRRPKVARNDRNVNRKVVAPA